jgi:quercetin dioxygenase-like cupin family protein
MMTEPPADLDKGQRHMDRSRATTPRGTTSAAARWSIIAALAVTGWSNPAPADGQAGPYVVRSADAPELGPGAARLKEQDKDGRPRPPPPFTVKVLADPVNVKAQQLSLTLLSVAPANRVAMHRHPRSAKALYLLKGHARLLGPPGTDPRKLDEGSAVFIPAGYPHVIENMGRQSPAVFLQAFAPPGPEKVYRDPKDPEGRADFEVIRDPAQAKAPPPSNGQVVVRSIGDVPPQPVPGSKGVVRALLAPRDTGSPALSLDVLELAPGAEVPRHQHPASGEVLYVVSGSGTLTVGSDTYPFAAEEAIHLPADQPHAARIASGGKMVAVQILAPAEPATPAPGTKF